MSLDPPTERWTWFRELLQGERLPCGLVDLDAFHRNADQLVAPARDAGKGLRPATKSLRCRGLMERVAARGGPTVRGWMAYAVREGVWLAEQGCDDVFVAYPTALADDWRLLAHSAAEGRPVSIVVDDVASLGPAAAAARAAGATLPLVVELDVSWRPARGAAHIGARRSPIRSPEQAVELARRIAETPGLRFDGLMGYDAHVAGVPDAVHGEAVGNALKRLMKHLAWPAATDLRTRTLAALVAAGLPPRFVNGGGTGSLRASCLDPALTEVTAGSGFVVSHLFDRYVDLSLDPALFFVLQVVRRSDPGLVTCQAGGWIASGAIGPDRLPVPYLPPGLRYVSGEGAGEVQTPLRLPEGVDLHPGDPVVFRHAKAGELAEHLETYLLVSGDRIVDRVPTYRGEGRCFP